MNRIFTKIIFALPLLMLAGCMTGGPSASTLEKANKGDVKAMFRVAEYQCAKEDASSHGAETLKWWKKIADGKDKASAAQANQYLGLFYLSLFANEDTYNPDKPEPIAYCTGSPAKPSYTKAIRYFTRCAESKFPPATACQSALGHLYLNRKNNAKAYFWYATVLAGMMDDIYGSDHENEVSPLDPKLSDSLAAQNARRAAEHLSLEQTAEIGKKAKEWVVTRDDKTPEEKTN